MRLAVAVALVVAAGMAGGTQAKPHKPHQILVKIDKYNGFEQYAYLANPSYSGHVEMVDHDTWITRSPSPQDDDAEITSVLVPESTASSPEHEWTVMTAAQLQQAFQKADYMWDSVDACYVLMPDLPFRAGEPDPVSYIEYKYSRE